MKVQLHRAGNTYYPHTAVLLNVPSREFDGFFGLPDWPLIAGAKFLGIPPTPGQKLISFVPSSAGEPSLRDDDLDELLQRQARGEFPRERFGDELEALRARRRADKQSTTGAALAQALVQSTGIRRDVWERSGQELVEALLPLEMGNPQSLADLPASSGALAYRLGLAEINLVSDYPILTATYGFSRVKGEPDKCRLNPFPSSAELGGRNPVFVDEVRADALLIRLDCTRVLRWLRSNGLHPQIPPGTNQQVAERAYFVQLLDGAPLNQSLDAGFPEARLVFGLLHTLSHACIRHASLLSGLDRTSLSEYLIPRALTFGLYCNHRFGATIGALTALFEQAFSDWLRAVEDTRRCVYDPVCGDTTGSCHACTHVAETSCRFFNLNLNRSFLFGGNDPHLGTLVGYFDPTLA